MSSDTSRIIKADRISKWMMTSLIIIINPQLLSIITKNATPLKLNEEKKQTVKKGNAVMGKGREQQYTYRVKNSMTTDGPAAKSERRDEQPRTGETRSSVGPQRKDEQRGRHMRAREYNKRDRGRTGQQRQLQEFDMISFNVRGLNSEAK